MFHTCDQRFDVMRNLEIFFELNKALILMNLFTLTILRFGAKFTCGLPCPNVFYYPLGYFPFSVIYLFDLKRSSLKLIQIVATIW